MGKIVETLLSEEEILYIMTNPEKLKKSCTENVESYFAAVHKLLQGTITLQAKRILFSLICHTDSERPL